MIYLALGRVDEAFADLDKVLSPSSRGPGTAYSRGRCHELKGRQDAAIADYRKALELIGKLESPDDYQKHVAVKARERLAALGVPEVAASR